MREELSIKYNGGFFLIFFVSLFSFVFFRFLIVFFIHIFILVLLYSIHLWLIIAVYENCCHYIVKPSVASIHLAYFYVAITTESNCFEIAFSCFVLCGVMHPIPSRNVGCTRKQKTRAKKCIRNTALFREGKMKTINFGGDWRSKEGMKTTDINKMQKTFPKLYFPSKNGKNSENDNNKRRWIVGYIGI